MKHLLCLLIALVIPLPALAYYEVLDTGEILPNGQYKLTGDLQALTDVGGLNAGLTFDMGFKDEFGMRALLGTGSTDISFGAMFKWMPIPDIKGQPAIGFNAGLVYGHYHGNFDTTVRFEPLLSKKFVMDDLVWTPYASLPIGVRAREHENEPNRTDFAWQIVGGTQLQVPKWKMLQFIAEFGVGLDHAPSHISLGAVYYFDHEKGLTLE